jgi:hypothetical protein
MAAMNSCEPFPHLPACYRGMADAFAAYNEAKEQGFDGNINEFLEMEAYHINRDHFINEIRKGAQGLTEMGERSLLRGIAAQILNEAS